MNRAGGLTWWGFSRRAQQLEARPLSGQEWASVSTGAGSACGVRRDGSLWCWGQNRHGVLGDGTERGSDEPVRAGEGGWASVSVAARHACAVKADGSLWCWGNNEAGQLGDGTRVNSSRPVRVPGEADWSLVSAWNLKTCGVRRAGTVWCWGYGPLGDDTVWPEPRRLDSSEP